jgi:hypothetical protein
VTIEAPDAFSKGKTPTFEESARKSLADAQLRRNIGKATKAIRARRTKAVEELPDWEELRQAGYDLKTRVVRHLDEYLLQLEESVQKAGGHVHWARDAGEANRIVADIAKNHDAKEVVKVKSIATDETKLNEFLEEEGIKAVETDLAELIIQLAGEVSSHILVPAIHKNRAEIRELFIKELDADDLSDDPSARAHHADGYRKGHPRLAGLRGLHAAPPPLFDRGADEPVHLVLDRGFGGGWTRGVPPGPHGQRADGGAGRRDRTADPQLYPLLGLLERLPGLRAYGRPRLQLGVPRPHRRHPHAAARRDR